MFDVTDPEFLYGEEALLSLEDEEGGCSCPCCCSMGFTALDLEDEVEIVDDYEMNWELD